MRNMLYKNESDHLLNLNGDVANAFSWVTFCTDLFSFRLHLILLTCFTLPTNVYHFTYTKI